MEEINKKYSQMGDVFQAKLVAGLILDMWIKENWTPTAIELWNDKKFIEKRIKEQDTYLFRLMNLTGGGYHCGTFWLGKYATERHKELFDSAIEVKNKLNSQLAQMVERCPEEAGHRYNADALIRFQLLPLTSYALFWSTGYC